MTEWSSLHHAYGTAENLPALLATAESSDDWDDAYSHLVHQGTVYSASYAALPLLTEMALRHPPAGYVAPLDLAAAILSSEDPPTRQAPSSARSVHSAQIRALHSLVQERLEDAESSSEFTYLLQSLMAFEGVDPWQRSLSWLADEEAMLDCPFCEAALLLDLSSTSGTLASFHEPALHAEVKPAEPAPESVEHRLLALARRHGWSSLEARMRVLFGDAQCPRYRTRLHIPAAIA